MRLGAAALIAIACVTGAGALSLRLPESTPFFIQDGKGVPGFAPPDRELARWALDAWSRESGGKLKFVEAKSVEAALVRLRWISAHEGLFGETQRVQVGGREGALVFVMPEVSQLGEPLAGLAVRDRLLRDAIVYLTCVHELGHAVGLPHTRNFQDIMYSFGYGGDPAQIARAYPALFESSGSWLRRGFWYTEAEQTAA